MLGGIRSGDHTMWMHCYLSWGLGGEEERSRTAASSPSKQWGHFNLHLVESCSSKILTRRSVGQERHGTNHAWAFVSRVSTDLAGLVLSSLVRLIKVPERSKIAHPRRVNTRFGCIRWIGQRVKFKAESKSTWTINFSGNRKRSKKERMYNLIFKLLLMSFLCVFMACAQNQCSVFIEFSGLSEVTV